MSVDRSQDQLNLPAKRRDDQEADPHEDLQPATSEHRLGQAMWRVRGDQAKLIGLLQGLPRVQRQTGRVVALRQLGAERGAVLCNRAFGHGGGMPSGQALMRKQKEEQGGADLEHPAVHAALSQAGHGEPLPQGVREEMEARFGVSFAQVRIHTDGTAAAAAGALEARAFTAGADIFFAAGSFAPGSPAGDRLLLHELTHVAQHEQGRVAMPPSGALAVSAPHDPLEREAEQVASGGPAPALADAAAGKQAAGPAPVLQRDPEPASPDAGPPGPVLRAIPPPATLDETTAQAKFKCDVLLSSTVTADGWIIQHVARSGPVRNSDESVYRPFDQQYLEAWEVVGGVVHHGKAPDPGGKDTFSIGEWNVDENGAQLDVHGTLVIEGDMRFFAKSDLPAGVDPASWKKGREGGVPFAGLLPATSSAGAIASFKAATKGVRASTAHRLKVTFKYNKDTKKFTGQVDEQMPK